MRNGSKLRRQISKKIFSYDICSPSPSDHPSFHCLCRHANPHSCEWFVFNPRLVVPSFLISLHYTSAVRTNLSLSLSCMLSIHTQGPVKSVVDHMTSRDPNTPTDDVILDHAPLLPPQPKLALLDEASILRVSHSTNLADVKVSEISKLCRFLFLRNFYRSSVSMVTT